MAIKVYKGGSWVNTTGVSAIGKADRLSIGQTDTSLATSDKNYYLSFVDANHPHTSRQYEDFYTGIGITYSPISKSLGVGGVLYLSGQENNFQGSIRSYGGADKLFVIYNESAEGVIAINPANSAGLNDVGIATFKRGAAVANDDSYFRSNVSPPKDCTGIYNLGKPEEKWNNVYANCFIGNGSGLDGTGDWKEDTYKNLKAGTEAGQSITAQTCYNIFAGFKSGCLTTGAGGAGGSDQIADGNVFLGTYTGRCNTTGAYNFYGGYVAGRGKADSTSTGDANVFIGRSAGQEINTGSNNTFLGKYAGLGIDSGDNNISAFGSSSAPDNAATERHGTGDFSRFYKYYRDAMSWKVTPFFTTNILRTGSGGVANETTNTSNISTRNVSQFEFQPYGGNDMDGSYQRFSGRIRRWMYYDKVMTQSQLATMTNGLN